MEEEEEIAEQETAFDVLGLIQLWMQIKQQETPRVPRSRSPSCPLKLLHWETFVAAHMTNNPKDFEKCIRMPVDAFAKLHILIKEKLHKDEDMAARRGGAIPTELRLYMTLRYLGGGAMHDIRRTVDVKKSTAYAVVYEVCQVIAATQQLQMKFPLTEQECQEAALAFRSISFDEAIVNCVGAIDGYLLHTEQPRKKLVGNQRQYYSGHYKKFGINIQAACDHECKFTYFALAGPGSMNDKVAVNECSLGTLISRLPQCFCVIGDAAYEPTERLTPIFYGVTKEEPLYDNFNFFASQLRIRIEMTFGLMQMKWRFLLQARQATRRLPTYVMAIALLHNYVTNYRLQQNASVEEMLRQESQQDETMLPSQPVDLEGNVMLYDENGNIVRRSLPKGHSILRHLMALRIQEKNLHRPVTNIRRHSTEDNADSAEVETENNAEND